MGSRLRLGRRAGATTALAAAVALVGATAANAHHCYKDVWADAAYAHHLAGGTPWTPLSDMGAMFIIGPALRSATTSPTTRSPTSWRPAG